MTHTPPWQTIKMLVGIPPSPPSHTNKHNLCPSNRLRSLAAALGCYWPLFSCTYEPWALPWLPPARRQVDPLFTCCFTAVPPQQLLISLATIVLSLATAVLESTVCLLPLIHFVYPSVCPVSSICVSRIVRPCVPFYPSVCPLSSSACPASSVRVSRNLRPRVLSSVHVQCCWSGCCSSWPCATRTKRQRRNLRGYWRPLLPRPPRQPRPPVPS